jgi:hypothetical protein
LQWRDIAVEEDEEAEEQILRQTRRRATTVARIAEAGNRN